LPRIGVLAESLTLLSKIMGMAYWKYHY